MPTSPKTTDKHYRTLGLRATSLARHGDWPGAERLFLQMLQIHTQDQKAWEGLVRARFARQNLDAAEQTAEEMQSRFPHSSQAILLQAHIQKARGNTDSAITDYLRVLEQDTHNGEALFNLVELRTPSHDDELAVRAKELANNTDAAIGDRINAGFAAGKILDRAGEYGQAFDHFQQANDLARTDLAERGIRYDRGRREQEVNRLQELYPARPGSSALPKLPLDLTPVFVLGLPRSGTTLVEQILASHPEVEALGELTAAHDCERQFRREREAAGGHGRVDPEESTDRQLLEAAREQYLDALFARNPEALYVVDKMPANFELIGFLRLLFPDSPIVHTLRQPQATLFSLYTANFGGHDPYNLYLGDLVHYQQQYKRIMAYWQQDASSSLTDLSYEALVSNPEQEIPALLEAVGLEFHPDCLRFHETHRPVLTASHHQVRQPMYRSAVDHWRHYAAWLTAFDAL